MATNSPSEFLRRLNLARNGGGILFCGAGFSADCLNFNPDEKIGTGAQLLEIFNAELKSNPPFKNLQNAADELHEKIADLGMMNLLKDRFTVSKTTSDMTDILRYPWQAIYTTNYDNAIEISAQSANMRTEPLNNTDDPNDQLNGVPVVHLHGYVQKWNVRNFRESCVLGADSYSKLTLVKKWLDRFRRDIDQAQIVVFVGFNAGDFHLNQAIYDLTGLREKSFFINRPTASIDPDVAAAQRRLGTPLFTGRSSLATTIRDALSKDAPKAPNLVSFAKYAPPAPASTVPTQAQIEDLLLYGKVEASQLARDSSNDVSEYHVQRSALKATLAAIAANSRIILLNGYPCDGKTMLVSDLSYRLSGERPVYHLRQAYDNLLNEVADIIHNAPNAAVIIENCFDLPPERLASVARQFDGQEGVLILTSRAVAADASPVGLASLQGFSSFWQLPVVRLDEGEVHALSDLADQIAGWRDFRVLDRSARLRFIQDTCQASLPHFLMRLLKSDYVTTRYREEFNKLSLSLNERSAIIVALYTTHIGENATTSFLSDALETDYGAIIDKINERAGDSSFCIVRRSGNMIQTVPSIGSENILKNLFSDAEIIDAIIPVMKSLAAGSRTPFEQRMFSQFMRFSILSNVVSDKDQIDRFFEHNKQEAQIRRMPLFWLQWHMAKCAAGEISVAEKFLEQGYAEAAKFEHRIKRKFDRRQLDDRRAKFLMLRAEKTNRDGDGLFRDFREAIALANKILRQDDPQHYPFETLSEIVRNFSAVKHRIDGKRANVIQNELDQLMNYARNRVNVLPAGYQRDKAQSALDDATS